MKRTFQKLFGFSPKPSAPEEPTENIGPNRVIGIGELMYVGGGPSVLKLPLFPERFRSTAKAEESIEFAAATIDDRIALGALVKAHNPMRLFELGTFRGVTAATLASNAPREAILFTLDLPPELESQEVASQYYGYNSNSGFHQMAAAGADRAVGELIGWYVDVCRIEQLYGDAETFDFNPYKGNIDLFFVDGCHEERCVLRDTTTAWKCLRPGGLLVWHDYQWDSVKRAIQKADLKREVTWVNATNIAFCQKAP